MRIVRVATKDLIASILLRRQEGLIVYYSIADNATVEMCQTVCVKIAADIH
ncbi:hypothetical protein [Polynucleobacter necessarius]|uniref:hypothetical protein n=1 Tax=Polynucleobacter necessarius TaxID=576610 RepID=UPI0018D4F665|nr:hypothetical protein [Polynucleobacter necessarius]